MSETANEETKSEETARPNLTIEVVRRNIKKVLPCRLTDEELLRIARMRTTKENEHDQLINEAKIDADKRKAQIKEYADEILSMRRELHTGYQERTVLTNEVFEKDLQGNYWIVVYRLDTNLPTGERWPASPSDLQRYLPIEETSGGNGLLTQAAKVQRSAQPVESDAEVPEGLPEDDGAGDDGDDDADADDDAPESKPRSRKKGK